MGSDMRNQRLLNSKSVFRMAFSLPTFMSFISGGPLLWSCWVIASPWVPGLANWASLFLFPCLLRVLIAAEVDVGMPQTDQKIWVRPNEKPMVVLLLWTLWLFAEAKVTLSNQQSIESLSSKGAWLLGDLATSPKIEMQETHLQKALIIPQKECSAHKSPCWRQTHYDPVPWMAPPGLSQALSLHVAANAPRWRPCFSANDEPCGQHGNEAQLHLCISI